MTLSLASAQMVIGGAYGLTREEVHRALAWARTAKRAAQARALETGLLGAPKPAEPRAMWDFARVPEPKDGKVMCAQCDRRVTAGEAERCRSQWCKAKVAIGAAIAGHEADKARAGA